MFNSIVLLNENIQCDLSLQNEQSVLGLPTRIINTTPPLVTLDTFDNHSRININKFWSIVGHAKHLLNSYKIGN